MSSPTSQHYEVYRNAVELVLNKWTGLRLAIENGMGGLSAINTAKEMIDYIAKYSFYDDVDENDIANALEEIMEQEFCTYLEDESPKEIGYVLKKFTGFCKNENFDDLQKELSQLPPGSLWITEGLVQKPAQSSSGDEDDEMDQDMPPVASTSGGTSNMIEADFDPEWTEVKSRRKRG